MFTKEWKTEYKGHKIVVSNNWGDLLSKDEGAKLYINGKCVDTNKNSFATGRTPILRGKITDNKAIHIVEVYMKSSLFKVKTKITVDDIKVVADWE